MGSKAVEDLQYRCGFAFIGIYTEHGHLDPEARQSCCTEKLAEKPNDTVVVTQVLRVNEAGLMQFDAEG